MNPEFDQFSQTFIEFTHTLNEFNQTVQAAGSAAQSAAQAAGQPARWVSYQTSDISSPVEADFAGLVYRKLQELTKNMLAVLMHCAVCGENLGEPENVGNTLLCGSCRLAVNHARQLMLAELHREIEGL